MFARTHKLGTKCCAQKFGITPPERKNLFEIFPGGPSGACLPQAGILLCKIRDNFAGDFGRVSTVGKRLPTTNVSRAIADKGRILFLSEKG